MSLHWTNCETWNERDEPTGEWAELNGGGKGAQISRLSGGFLVFHI